MALVGAEEFNENLRRIRETVGESLARAGRGPDDVRIMAVTKGFPREAAETAAAAGLDLLGENRVQEAEAKFGTVPPPAELHLIGHLQTNKARKAAALVACVQSIDKYETAAALDRHAAALGKRMPVLLELNTSGEESKSGYGEPAALLADLDRIRALPSLAVAGLMTVGPLAGGERAARAAFVRLKTVFEEIRSRSGLPDFRELSMGMSQDYAMAVEEGATLVRIGTALFGERSYSR
ncbi:MAG: YggS family pyridoxal phosphate-dependent enzyme [Spirochaetales bacterium]|nr:YggS family pyridoxal phosphate-dependent enzyme [Spirochaetales bacterium]